MLAVLLIAIITTLIVNAHDVTGVSLRQVLDMRWGVTDETMNDHQVTDLCLREIDICKQTSVGPYFVVSSLSSQSTSCDVISITQNVQANQFQAHQLLSSSI